jgi:hypothetical protein
MKTTIELPDTLFRRAKSLAACEGKSLKELFTEAIEERLCRTGTSTSAKPWERAFGGLRDLHRETKRVERIITAEFEDPI